MLNEINLATADLNLLVVFEAVLAERHVGRAAERLGLTPSAVSHALGRLRQLLRDPLFVRTPKGVVPTAGATELAEPIADVLARTRSVLSRAAPFDPKTSTRRFAIGAPDGASAVFVPPMLVELRRAAPAVDISVRQLLPAAGELSPDRAWRLAIAKLEDRELDVAIIPTDQVPARFVVSRLYDEDFVIAARAGHPFTKNPTLARYCELEHLVVSLSGDAYGFVDEALARQGRKRRIALTVPNFMLALALVAESPLVAACPRRLVAAHGSRFGIVAIESPVPLRSFRLHAVAPKAAMMDEGLKWIFEVLRRTQGRDETQTRGKVR
jgi:DNA-binding transcriptional LysR family regulator